MATSTNQHLPEADDRFVEALLEEHARLGSGDDLALLALIRARTEEQPEIGHRSSSNKFGVRQWLQVAAVVALIGVALTAAFRHFAPGNSSDKTGNGIVAAPTNDSSEEPEYTIRIKNVTTSPQVTVNGGTGAAPGQVDGNAVGNLFTAGWQSPLNQPLSAVPFSQDTAADTPGTLSLEEMQTLLAAGNPLPAGAVTVSSLLKQLPLTKPQEADDDIRLAAAACPWNADHQLVHVSVDSSIVKQASSPLRQPGFDSEGSFPVFSQIAPSLPQSTVSLSAGADPIDRELIRIALAQITQMALGEEPVPSPELVIEFNPAQVSNYRLIGHATNLDGQLTALYEIKNAERANPGSASQGTDLKYQPANASDDLFTASCAGQATSINRAQTVDWQQASNDLQLTAAAALFASIVESGTPPSREQLQFLSKTFSDIASSSPKLEEFRAVISLWSETVITKH